MSRECLSPCGTHLGRCGLVINARKRFAQLHKHYVYVFIGLSDGGELVVKSVAFTRRDVGYLENVAPSKLIAVGLLARRDAS